MRIILDLLALKNLVDQVLWTYSPAFEPNSDYGVTLTIDTGSSGAALSDAIIALKLLAGVYINPEGTHADADESGIVEISDVVYTLQKISGLKN